MEEKIRGSKMLVHVAESGQSFEIECQPSSPIELIQDSLASLTRLPVQDQLLISGDTRLESQHSLASYKLPAEGRDVFLFNRRSLMGDSTPIESEELDPLEPQIPLPPSTSNGSHPLDESLDPALKALPSYERQFKYHFQKAHAIYVASQSRYEACRRLLREQQVQKKALETAKGNVDHYYKIICQIHAEFMKHFNWQQKQHTDLLMNFERDLDRLRAWKLHPDLLSNNFRTLLDFVKEINLKKAFETCSLSHRQFQVKVQQLKSTYMELQQNVEELSYKVSPVDLDEVEKKIDNQKHFLEEVKVIMQSLSKDVNIVKKLVDDCVSSKLAVSLRPHDAVSALGPMYEIHDKDHLPRMETCFKELGKLLSYCRSRKEKMSMCVHTGVQRVALLQSRIRDMRNQLAAFKEAMVRQDEVFSDIWMVRRIGPAYKACLAEVVRRKAGMKLYMGMAGQLAEKMAQKRDLEIARREEFFRIQSTYIPRDVLASMGLLDVPSQCVVNIAPYDTNLLDLDITDLERYAPEAIVGEFSKGTGVGDDSKKSCFEGLDAETDEDTQSSVIAGTSKIEVENAWLKAELASAIALLCSFDPNLNECFQDDNDGGVGDIRKNVTQKTAEALEMKNEYARHLQNMLKMSQMQCSSYENRILELEQRLSDQYMDLHKPSSPGPSKSFPLDDVTLLNRNEEATSISNISEITRNTLSVLDPMDGVSCSTGACPGHFCPSNASTHRESVEHTRLLQEGGDETMSEFSGGDTSGDAATLNPCQEDPSKKEECGFDALDNSNYNSDVKLEELPGSGSFNAGTSEKADTTGKDTVGLLRESNNKLLILEERLEQKIAHCAALEENLKCTLDDVTCLRRELEENSKLLSECQINCAHLENRLHEAREEARTNLCAADRRAVQYNTLRASSVKLCALVERLRLCVSTTHAGSKGFTESLRALAVSLMSNDNPDDATAEFRACIRVLAEKVCCLAQERTELLERYMKAESNQSRLLRELETKSEVVKNLWTKQKTDKQIRRKYCPLLVVIITSVILTLFREN